LFFNNYQGLFQEWEIRYARALILQFQMHFKVLEREGSDDLMQECLTHWYFKRDQYDPSKPASCRTYMRSVLENKLRDIVQAKERNIRKAIYNSLPIDMFLIDDKDDLSGCFTIIDKELERAAGDDVADLLARAIEKLSHRQRELCRLIQEESLNMKQVGERLNIPRGTLFDEVLRIRDVFRQEGLRDYL
jgi:RNA polymerase sigma-70 factor (ECF subfamily)